VVVLGTRAGAGPLVVALAGAALCFLVRLVGVRFHLDAPHPPGRPE
jgi:hypothetical protein